MLKCMGDFFLLGAPIILEYFMKAQKLNKKQARWALYLSRFDFTLKHVPGSRMGKADSLSRRLD